MAKTQYREGGWGWFLVLSGFMAHFIVIGTLKAFGVLVTAMKEDLDTDLWIVGSVGTLHLAVELSMTPLTSAIAQKVGGRHVVTCGATLCGLGLVLSSTTYNVAIFAVTLVLVAGIGAACTVEIIRAEMALYFHEKYALANFIVYTGAPIAMMVYGPVTQVLLDTYGWRGAMLLIGGVGCNLIWAGLLVRRPTGIYASIPHEDPPTGPNTQSCEQNSTNRPPTKLRHLLASAMGFDVFLNFEFMLMAGLRMCNVTVGTGILVYMVPNGLSLGLSSKEASFLTTAFGAGNLAGLVLGILASHKHVLSFHATVAFAATVAAIALAVGPFIPTFIGQMVNTFIIGAGVFFELQVLSVMTRFLPFEDGIFVIVLGWLCCLSGVAIALGDTLAGWLYDATRSFQATFFMFSATMVVGVLLLLVDFSRAFFKKRSKASYRVINNNEME